jgi:signal transduction histidine kinase
LKKFRYILSVLILLFAVRGLAQPLAPEPAAPSLDKEKLLQEIKTLSNLSELDSTHFEQLDQAIYLSEKESFGEGIVAGYETAIKAYNRTNELLPELEYLLQFNNYLEENGETRLNGEKEYRLGEIFMASELWIKAKEALQQADTLLQNFAASPYYFKTIKQLASVYEITGSSKLALQTYEKAEHIALHKQDAAELLWIMQQKSTISHNNKDYPTEVKINKRIKEVTDSIANQRDQNIAVNNLGYSYIFLKDYIQANAHFKEVMVAASNNDTALAILHQNKGIMHQHQREYLAAIKEFKTAASIHKKLKNRAGEVKQYNFISQVYYQQDDRDAMYNSLLFANKADTLSRYYKLPEIEMDVCLHEADIYQKLFEYDKALLKTQRHYKLKDSLRAVNQEQQNDILQRQLFINKLEKDLRASFVSARLAAIELEKERAEKAQLLAEKARLVADSIASDAKVKQLEADKRRSRAETEQLRLKNEKEAQEKLVIEKQLMLLKEQRLRQDKEFELNNEKLAKARKEAELRKKESELQRKELEAGKQQSFIRNMFIVFIVVILLLIISIIAYRQVRSKSKQIELQRAEIAEQADELQASNEKLIELDGFKEGMTSMIVHDLKNPLNAILNTDNNLPVQKQFQSMQQSGRLMLNMVMDILDVNKYEETRMTLSLGSRYLVEVASDAVEQVAFLAERRGVTLVNNVDENLCVYADRDIIERIIVNLLTNAIKYSPIRETVTVGATVSEGIVRITVSDNGQGIREENIETVFSKFGQVDVKKSGDVRSTGLGLTFCKMAAEAHDGDIGVESVFGEGSTFWFTLPEDVTQRAVGRELARKVEAQTSGKTGNELSAEDRAYLHPFALQLKDLAVYKVSNIRKILQQVEAADNAAIDQWKTGLQLTIGTGNQEQYEIEINKILDEGV